MRCEGSDGRIEEQTVVQYIGEERTENTFTNSVVIYNLLLLTRRNLELHSSDFQKGTENTVSVQLLVNYSYTLPNTTFYYNKNLSHNFQ